MTKRLYYQDSKLISFNAEVIGTKPHGNSFAIQLNQTAFYPTSGGQPHDTGVIGNATVLDVWEDENAIWHLLPSLIESISVKCRINWPRRFDHMQQHTGQHILSAVFYQELERNTIGFHLGDQNCTIDLDGGPLNDKDLSNIEEIANKYIWGNHPVTIQFITEDQIRNIPFRKAPQVTGTIRVVRIGDLDVSACGGTHVYATGEIGLIKITGSERYKSGSRISFICGGRAFKNFQKHLKTIKDLCRQLSIHPDDLPEAIQKMQMELKSNLSLDKRIRKELSAYRADELWQKAPTKNGMKIIYQHWEELSTKDLQEIVKQINEHTNTISLLTTIQENAIRIICSRSQDLKEIDANLILQKATKLLGGKGGGSSEMAQGGAPIDNPKSVMKKLEITLQDYL